MRFKNEKIRKLRLMNYRLTVLEHYLVDLKVLRNNHIHNCCSATILSCSLFLFALNDKTILVVRLFPFSIIHSNVHREVIMLPLILSILLLTNFYIIVHIIYPACDQSLYRVIDRRIQRLAPRAKAKGKNRGDRWQLEV